MKKLFLLLFPSMLFSLQLLRAEPLPPLWRLPDGNLGPVPEGQQVGATSARVLPKTTGSPAFPLPFAVEAGDVVAVQMTLEAIRTEQDLGAEGQSGLILTILPRGAARANNPDVLHRQIAIIGSEAETIRFAFRANAASVADGLLLVPSVSYFDRGVELRDLGFVNHGKDADPAALTRAGISYRGQEADAPWRKTAAENIERHRKSDLRIVVTDRWGTPLPGIGVSVEQQQHAYPFGTAVVASRIVDAPREFTPESGMTREKWLADNVRYREELLRNFNCVVTENDLKWPQWANSNARPGVFHQQWTLDALQWFQRHPLITKGHTLIWGSWRFTPPWLREAEAEPETIQRAILTHIRDVGGATEPLVRYWDVLNEPMSHRNLIELLGMDKVAAWFLTARDVMPNTRLVINEFDMVGNGGSPARRKNFLLFVQELLTRKAPIDVIGFQGHFWSERFTAPEDVWTILDEVHLATGLPVMVSEFDSNLPNEQMQADYTRDFLTAWFSHPATEAFIMWGFWGGAHWMGDSGAMFRTDWSEKPNLAAYRSLVYGEWWTREHATSDAQGTVALRAFHGQHVLHIHSPGTVPVQRAVILGPQGLTLHVVLHPEQQ